MAAKKSIGKDMILMLVGLLIIIAAVASLFWTSQSESLKEQVISFVIMFIGIFVSILGYNS
jgi:uncharacterized membrane protein